MMRIFQVAGPRFPERKPPLLPAINPRPDRFLSKTRNGASTRQPGWPDTSSAVQSRVPHTSPYAVLSRDGVLAAVPPASTQQLTVRVAITRRLASWIIGSTSVVTRTVQQWPVRYDSCRLTPNSCTQRNQATETAAPIAAVELAAGGGGLGEVGLGCPQIERTLVNWRDGPVVIGRQVRTETQDGRMHCAFCTAGAIGCVCSTDDLIIDD
ncbi:hypothetical protein EJ06DRAFT_59486 [Trichodelitschia bisporula]|uniref:Uncharacterized protein n=1 Tax=Trichodelitschia bisporula TaxID=703511 RepID=A0A6G1HUK6_9PEZI|nr:hypothetical protein EJ06DRAFT_59486 [Trichodelitschia bisporula]